MRAMWLFFQRLIALTLLLIFAPFFVFLKLLIEADDGGVFLYKQKRMGKGKRPLLMYKFRTMVKGAEKLKAKYRHLNEAGGPAFKIYNDPRHTRVGRFLAHTGLDELPQLINIIKGEMAFVGPRPLPWEEAKKVPKKYQKRFSVLPGITSSWVVQGSHNLSFDGWMKLDLEYTKRHSFWLDLQIMFLTVLLVFRVLVIQISKVFK